MQYDDQRVSRRSVLGGFGVGIGAGLLGDPYPVLAQSAGPDTQGVWSADYRATKGAVELAVYRKRLGPPRPGEKARPVLVLVHGSSVSAIPTYDLTVPGAGEYSVMNAFARYGFDVWTVDCENYGRSSRTDSSSDISSGSDDLKATADVIARETGQTKFHLFGESSGGLRAALFASRYPDSVGRLVLAAYTYTGEGSPTLATRAKDLDYYKSHARRLRDQKMIDSIFTRDKPGTSDPAVAAAIGVIELKYGDQVPTGTYLDMVENLPIVDPEKLGGPVMMMRGEYDGIATMDDLVSFYKKLPSGDRQFVVVPATAHSVVWGKNRRLFWYAMRNFLTEPGYAPA
jgi:pimeloyl-ACP methyl ester carboxylesterase